jgi:exodeoxyribonuclease VII large subunit
MLRLQRAAQNAVYCEQNRLSLYEQRIINAVHGKALSERGKLDVWLKTIELHSPERIFKMGYSLTTVNGKLVRHQREVNQGDILETHLHDGVIQSVVK